MGKLLVVTAAATAALTLPATAALADGGHHDHFRHGHGHHVAWFWPHWAGCPCATARPVVAARRAAPSPASTRPASEPVPVVAAALPSPPPSPLPSPQPSPQPVRSSAAPPTLVVGTPAAAAQVPLSWAGLLPAVAGAAVVVTLISLGFSVRRGLARVD